MRPNAAARQVTTGGVTASGEFGISRADEVHIMGILRDTLYSDKVLAVLREYSANAWDANRVVGKGDVPIKVTLPTEMDPTLRIRDYGPGMSPDDVFQVYTQYGASTKRGDDISVGMLGIGSKSAFAYSDSFTVTSWNDGWKRMYVAVLDESNRGKMNMLHEEACDYEETGIEILVAVKPEDIEEFESKAQQLFKHFDPRPEINTELPEVTEERVLTGEGVIWREHYNSDREWIAVMGCVPYEVDISEIIDREIQGESCGEYLNRLAGLLYFNIGEVEISASRERLKYSDKTKLALIRKVNKVVDEYVRLTLEEIRNSKYSQWQKRCRAQLFNELKLPVPDELKEEVKDVVELQELQSFYIVRRGDGERNHTRHIAVADNTRLLRRDDNRTVAQYQLREFDYVIYPKNVLGQPEFTWDQINLELEQVLEKAGITGVYVGNLSMVPWLTKAELNGKPKSSTTKKVNKKHKVRTFKLDPSEHFSNPYSECWKVESRVPTPDDVFVLIEKFKVESYGFYRMYRRAEKFSEQFGDGTMPDIYGYKSTKAKPVNEALVTGTEFRTWHHAFMQKIVTPEIEKKMELVLWAHDMEEDWYWRKGKAVPDIVELLGKKHPITKFVAKQFGAYRKLKKMGSEKRSALKELAEYIKYAKRSQFATAKRELLARYPLINGLGHSFDILLHSNKEAWAEYIQVIDRYVPVTQQPAEQEEEENDASTTVYADE